MLIIHVHFRVPWLPRGIVISRSMVNEHIAAVLHVLLRLKGILLSSMECVLSRKGIGTVVVVLQCMEMVRRKHKCILFATAGTNEGIADIDPLSLARIHVKLLDIRHKSIITGDVCDWRGVTCRHLSVLRARLGSGNGRS